jgi:hypothetical protein
MTVRTDAQARHERVIAMVLELDVDKCNNVYGSAPCTAAAGAGNECYNTYATCQDKANFVRGTVTKKFCSRGLVVPGETVRPYITGNAAVTPTEIVPSKGLAMRSQTQIKLVDEPCPDHLEDPYSATRAKPATGTFWARFMARNSNLVGRVARVRQGYVVAPFDWATFQTQLFIIDAVRGPAEDGSVTLVLSDVLKLADRNMVPAATAGKLAAAVAAISHTGAAQAGGPSTVTLATTASAVDSAYNGQEVFLVSGTGAGQRRVVASYVGATRVATLSLAWAVQPVSGTVYEVSPLSLDVGSASAAQYTDPATSGKNEYIRINDEVIRYTAKTGSVLSWTDSTLRAQFGTTRGSHSVGDVAQLCRAWISKRPWEVLRDIFVESGISLSYLDTTAWQTEDTDWLNGSEITAIITSPEKAADLASELLRDVNAVMWWSPVDQKVEFQVNRPAAPTPLTLDDDAFMLESTKVERLDAERITQAAVYYALRNATANVKEAKNYQAAAITIDADAQSANEYGDVRPSTIYSRWLGAANAIFATTAVNRRVLRLRNAPAKISFKVDPRNELALSQMLQISTRRLAGSSGAPRPTQARVVKVADKGAHFEVAALTVGWGSKRYAYIAPNGQPDYGAATTDQRLYGYISNTTTGKMTNGDDGYAIL